MHVVQFYKPKLVILNDTKYIGNDSEKFECVRKLIIQFLSSISIYADYWYYIHIFNGDVIRNSNYFLIKSEPKMVLFILLIYS